MCSGGGGGRSYTPPKVDPVPTVVQSSDVGTSDATKSQKRRHGRASTMLSSDRDTILGGATGNGRTTLG